MMKTCLTCDKEILDETRRRYCSGFCKREHDNVKKAVKNKTDRRLHKLFSEPIRVIWKELPEKLRKKIPVFRAFTLPDSLRVAPVPDANK